MPEQATTESAEMDVDKVESETVDAAGGVDERGKAPPQETGTAADAGNLKAADTQDEGAASKTASSSEHVKAPHTGSHYHQKKQQELVKSVELLEPEAEGQRTVYVANLDWSVDEARLHRLFSRVEGVKEVRLVRDFLQRSKGYAYVDYETPAQVDEAVEKLNGLQVNKRAMKVARSKPTKTLFEEKTVFVSKLAAAATEAEVRKVFETKGEIVDVRLPQKDASSKAHKGYAYVEYAAASAVPGALTLDGTEIAGQAVQVARSIPMKDHRHQTAAPRKDLPSRSNQRLIIERKLEERDPVKQASKCPTTVYVKNLAFGVDDEALRKHFEELGEVDQVLICRNNQGHSKGFGFVEFATEQAAQDALALTDSVLQGREIVVSRSQRAITTKKKPEAKEVPPAAAVPSDESKTEETKPAAAAAPAPAVAAAASASLPEGVKLPRVKRRLNLDDTTEAKGPQAKKLKAAANDSHEGKAVGGKEIAAGDTEAAGSKKAAAVHVPFRVAKAEKGPGEVAAADDGATAEEKAAGDAEAAPKPMSNADFRALLLKGA